mgnify:CR=1 FL=1
MANPTVQPAAAAQPAAKPAVQPAPKPAVKPAAKPAQPPAVVKPAQTPAKPPPLQPAAAKLPPVRSPAPKSRMRPRHRVALLSFVLMVLSPSVVSGWYLWTRAADQYASSAGFTVRSEDAGSAIPSLLGSLNLGGGQTPDADILYDFIQSQDLVAGIDSSLGLRSLWSKPDPDIDPIFAFDPEGSVEDLRDYWRRMVDITHDGRTGLLALRVRAFTPEDAKMIAEAVTEESTKLINTLSVQARADAVRYTEAELAKAIERLKEARRALTEFRNRTQIVDPSIDVQGQAGLLNQLHTQLAGALIELDLLRQTTRAEDPRISQSERRVSVIEARIGEEKRKLGIGEGGEGREAFATLVGQYETLVVDREFAEQTYTATLVAHDAAQSEARRQSRYLAIHQRPTLAEEAEYPKRLMLWSLISLFAFLLWAVTALVAYSLKDRQ